MLDPRISWSIAAIVSGLILAAALIVYSVRKKPKPSSPFEEVDGTLKTDWTRTGNIDFRTTSLDDNSPQQLLLRVEEKKIVENLMGEDVVQLRWRLATIDEAKEVIVCWRNRKSLEL